MSYIYVLKSEAGPVKIGRSDRPTDREQAANTSSPHRVKLAYSHRVENSVSMERTIHACLSAYRMNGEWFDITEDLAISEIKRICGQEYQRLSPRGYTRFNPEVHTRVIRKRRCSGCGDYFVGPRSSNAEAFYCDDCAPH
jgi:hypothetical protein